MLAPALAPVRAQELAPVQGQVLPQTSQARQQVGASLLVSPRARVAMVEQPQPSPRQKLWLALLVAMVAMVAMVLVQQLWNSTRS